MVKWSLQGLSDLQLGDNKFTLNHLVYIHISKKNTQTLWKWGLKCSTIKLAKLPFSKALMSAFLLMMFGHKRHVGIAANNDEASRHWPFSLALITELTVTMLGNTSLGSRSLLLVHFVWKGQCSWVCQLQDKERYFTILYAKHYQYSVLAVHWQKHPPHVQCKTTKTIKQKKHVPKEHCLRMIIHKNPFPINLS